jgi:copper resistance protein C
LRLRRILRLAGDAAPYLLRRSTDGPRPTEEEPALPHPPRRSAGLAAAIVLAGLLGSRGGAAAHAIVVASDPPAGAELAAPPTQVAVRFNSRIDHARSRLTLVGPLTGQDGTALVLEAHPGTDPVALDAAVPRPLAAGAWRLRWQVLALDGHITRGDIPFSIRPH